MVAPDGWRGWDARISKARISLRWADWSELSSSCAPLYGWVFAPSSSTACTTEIFRHVHTPPAQDRLQKRDHHQIEQSDQSLAAVSLTLLFMWRASNLQIAGSCAKRTSGTQLRSNGRRSGICCSAFATPASLRGMAADLPAWAHMVRTLQVRQHCKTAVADAVDVD